MHQLGGDLYVKKATVEFHASALMDDRLDVCLRCGRIGTSSMVFTGAIFRGDELLITCELVYVFADPATPDFAAGAGGPARHHRRLRGRRADGRSAHRRLGRAGRRGPAHPHRGVRARSSAFRPRWNGTTPTPAPSMRWRSTGWARRWPPGACCRSAGRGADRPHGGAPDAARLGRGPAGAADAAGGGRRRAATAKRCCMPSAAPRSSTAAWASAARRSLRGSGHRPHRDGAGIAGRLTHGPQETTSARTRPGSNADAAAAPGQGHAVARCAGRAPSGTAAPAAGAAARSCEGAGTVAILALMMFLAPALGVPHEEMLQDTLKSIVVSFAALGAGLLFFWRAAAAPRCRCAGTR